MQFKGGNQQRIKEINERRILDLIRLHEQLSCVQLKEKMELDAKSITNIKNRLLKKKLIIPAGVDPTPGRGRPQEFYELNRKYGYVVGLDFGATHMTGVAVNFVGESLKKIDMEIDPSASKASLVDTLISTLSALIEVSDFSGPLLGIGLLLPGMIDMERKTSMFAVNLPNWKDVPISQILEDRFSVDIEIESGSRGAALGEGWFGACKYTDDFVFIDIGYGIGSGIMTKGTLNRGAMGASGEIGHTVVQPYGRRCTCGNFGCLETVASGRGIAELVKEKISQGIRTSIKDIVEGDLDRIDAKIVMQAAIIGDRLSINTLEECGLYLGIAIANLINILNPSFIVMGGRLAQVGDLILVPMKNAIEKNTMPISFNAVEIVESELGEYAGAYGGTVLILRKIFKEPLLT